MTGGRAATALVAVVVVGCLAVPAGVGAAQTTDRAATGAYVTVSNVTVSPQTPEPGERVTVTAEFRNSESSTGAVDITQASLRGGGIRGSVSDLGSLGPGDRISVPFTATFDDAGRERLEVVLRGTGAGGSIVVARQPVYVDVAASSGVSLAFSTVFETDPAAGAATPVNVTVVNGDSRTITGVELDLGGEAAVEDPQRVEGAIETGGERTFEYDVTFDEVGERTLAGEVTYRTTDGITRSTTRTVTVTVAEPSVEADLSARSAANGSGETVVELTNFGNTEFTDVEVTATADGEVVARNLVRDVEPDASRSVPFDVASSVDGTVTYTATYTAAGATRETTVRDRSAVSGEIRLVSVSTTRTGAGVAVRGDAANVGSTTAESVLLSVVDGDGVSPTAPTGEYYVGEIEGSEFGTFELTADVANDTGVVPVEMTYVVDGDRVTTTQRIDLAVTSSGGAVARNVERGQAGGPSGGSDGGLPVLALAVALAVVGVVGVVVYRRRGR